MHQSRIAREFFEANRKIKFNLFDQNLYNWIFASGVPYYGSGYNLFGIVIMQIKTLNTIVIVIGIIYAFTCFITPQSTLNEYEPLILLCFVFPYGFLIVWAILKAGKDRENKDGQ